MTYTLVRILSYVLGITGTALALPLAVAFIQGETKMIPVFMIPMILAWIVSLIFFFKFRGNMKVIGIQEAFGVVGFIWIAICLFGAIPLYCSGVFPSLTDALFESVSGFTTTGATVLSDIDSIPRSVALWRCQSHWLGGMGVVALAVAMIPLLGAGGFRLIKAETTGPDKGKFTSNIATTAKILWFLYVGFTVVQAILLKYVGLGWIDALAHAFSSVATGGFSTRTASVGAFGIPVAEWICMSFILLASVNFVLYCRIFTGKIADVFKNSEFKVFLLILPIAVLSILIVEALNSSLPFPIIFRNTCFTVASVISTTGFMTADYTTWTNASQIIIIALFFVGGCSGSTAGGVKIIRWTILGKQLANEMRRLVHPYGVYSLRINDTPARDDLVQIISSFIFAYLLLVLITAFFGALAGLDIISAFTGALGMVGNIGPAFGPIGPSGNYGDIPVLLKWWYMFAMLAGRLEIYTLLLISRCFSHNSNQVQNLG
jgi:trk system potassium uptake protein TrkH